MKNIFTLALLFFATSLFAQPVNDDCSGIIDLGVAPSCDSTVYTNVDATATDIGNDNIPTNCGMDGDWTFTGRDVWFQFTSSDTILDYSFTIDGVTDGPNGGPLMNPQIAIYRGDFCGFDEMALFACARAEDGATSLELELEGLDFNTPYFIRINDWSSSADPNSGDFTLCIEEKDPINTIDQMGSTACTGELFDSGGPDNDYGPDENNSFSICPPSPNNGCVTFNLQYFNIGDIGDELNFYDGPDVNSPQIVSIDGFDLNGDNNGGVCYTVQASSGCLTVELLSDGNLEFEGFAATWECSIMPCEPLQAITIDDDIVDQDIIDNITTPQTLVTIDTIICEEGAYGTFLAGDDTDLGLERGLLLTSGSANQVAGPAAGAAVSNGLGTPGDSDLDYLSDLLGNGSLSNDACIVELDVFVATNELNFEYVFGSEEYPEFVGGQFNDIFTFLVSGPGIVGDPNIDNQLNIATLPGTNTPVEINSVNNSTNWQYYRNNEDGQSVAYDGLTSDFLGVKKSLTATVNVTPCETYHLKLAVADRGDNILDSGVFIGELKGGTPNSAFNSNLGLDFLVEDCTGNEDEITITLNNPQDDDQSYVVNISGTATRDIDYVLNMPDTITIPAGTTQLSFGIIPLSDGLTEGTETIIIQLTSDFGCGVVELSALNIDLFDEPAVEINNGLDTVLVCQDSCALLSAFGGATYFWTPPGIFDDDTSPNPIACPDSSQWVTVSGSIGILAGCSDIDSVFLQIVDPTMMVVTTDETNICEGDSVRLEAVNNVDNLNLSWMPEAGLDDPNSPNPLATPTTTTTYTATVDVFGCLATDEITINVDPFDFPEVVDDSILCQGSVVQLAEAIPGSTTDFEWDPADFLDDPSLPNATAILNAPGVLEYILTATSESGFCSQQDTVEFNVLAAEINIEQPDTVYICLGDSINLTAAISSGGIGLTWFPDDSISSTVGNTEVTVFPSVSTWYFASLSVGECSVLDSVFVRVDSLPDLSIMADPEKDPYCSGEFVTLSSPIFDPDNYPDIEHLWLPLDGQQTDSTFLNLVISTSDTITYFRTTTNNACVDTSEITLNVIPPIELEITNDTSVCEFEPVQLNVGSDDPDATFTWTPDAGLSCVECPDPLATLSDTITYTVEGDVFGCPATAQVTVNVERAPELDLPVEPTICLGESTVLNTDVDPDATYTWTSIDPNFGTVVDPTPMVTPDSSYTYFVTMSKEVCPDIQGQVDVNVIINILQIPNDTTICQGDTLQLDVTSTSPSATYMWTPSTGLSCDDCPTPFSTASDTVQYTVVVDAEGCVSNTSFTLNVVEAPMLDLANDTTVCAGDSILLNTIADPNATYTWTSADPSFTNINNPTPWVTPDSTYTYSVLLEKDFCENLEGEVTVNAVINEVTVDPLTNSCPFETIQLNINTTATDVTYDWSPELNLSCTDCPNPTTFLSDSVMYTVVVDADGCLGGIQFTVPVTDLPNPNLPNDAICFGDDISLNPPPGQIDPTVNYNWTSTDPNFVNTSEENPNIIPLVSADYTLTTEKDGCTEEHFGSVEVIELIDAISFTGETDYCLGDEVNITAQVNPTSSQDQFTWTPGNETGETLTIDSDALGVGDYKYFVAFNNGCTIDLIDSITFTIHDAEQIASDSIQILETLIEPDTCYEEGETIMLSIIAGNIQSGSTINWQQGGQSIGSGRSIEVVLAPSNPDPNLTTVDMTFEVEIITQFGCVSTAERTIPVKLSMSDMPNAFTPDGDNENDFFGPVTIGLFDPPTTFRIWNRYGQMVYNNENSDGWDGNHKGRPAPSDVYLYHIIYQDLTGEVIERKGEVTLIR